MCSSIVLNQWALPMCSVVAGCVNTLLGKVSCGRALESLHFQEWSCSPWETLRLHWNGEPMLNIPCWGCRVGMIQSLVQECVYLAGFGCFERGGRLNSDLLCSSGDLHPTAVGPVCGCSFPRVTRVVFVFKWWQEGLKWLFPLLGWLHPLSAHDRILGCMPGWCVEPWISPQDLHGQR